MESVNHNCNSQIRQPINISQKDDTTKSTPNQQHLLLRERQPFTHRTFAFSLVGFIFFYCIIWNLEDKTNLAKASTLFTYVNSIINTACWLIFYITENADYLIYGISSLAISLIAELFYGRIHYPEYMYALTTYTHHIVFLFLICISFWYDYLQYTSLVMIVELPTFIFHYMRRYSIREPWLNYSFGISFFLLRIVYWVWFFLTHPILSGIKPLKYFTMLIECVFMNWFIVWLKKIL